jgi:GGDEF domain-containing protein
MHMFVAQLERFIRQSSCYTSYNFQMFLVILAVDFFNQINMLYGTITEFCTPESCPVMSAGPK